MEGLIPFVIDAIRKSQNGRGGAYRCVSSDGSSHGSRRRLMDYWELPAAGEAAAALSNKNGGERSEVGVHAADARRSDEHVLYPRPAAVVAGSAYRRK